MNKRLLYLFLFALIGCNSKGEKKFPGVFFAGEIVNPTDDYVVLYKGNMVIDSAKLDENNRFEFKLDSISDGLYHFNHTEYQYVYLEKGDSLMIRLNTVEFDESLVFSGVGEDINNFLLNLFLVNEEEEQMMFNKYYPLEPMDFSKRMDSLRDEKLADLNTLESETKLSEESLELAKANINYTYDNYKERYVFEHKKSTRENKVHKVPDGFYNYRETVEYGNKNLTFLKPYYDFMKSHFGNLSYTNCSHKCAMKDSVVKNQLHFNRHKLNLIDSLIVEKNLRDNLFRNVAFDYLLNAHDSEQNNDIFIDEFHKLSGNNQHIKEIDDLYLGIKNIQPNKVIPDVDVANFEGQDVSLRDIAKNRKTVFYFWSGADKSHYNNMVKRVKQLSIAKPEYFFVGINLMTDETTWKVLMENKGLDPSTQYRAKDFRELTKTLIIYPQNKCIITDDAKIVDAFSTMYASF